MRPPRHVRALSFAILAVLLVGFVPRPAEPLADPLEIDDAAGRAAVSPPPAWHPPAGVVRPHDKLSSDLGEPPPRPLAPHVLEGYVWPLPKGRLTLGFGPSRWGSRVVDGELFHDGIDLATFCGDRIVAAHDGVVLAAGRRFDEFMGWQGDLAPYFARLDERRAWSILPIAVVVDDGNGYRSVYAHFREVVVEPGQRVRAGELIGYEGDTGRATGCHLHYGLFSPIERAVFEISPDVVQRMLVPRYQTARIDPLLVLPSREPPPPPRPRRGGP